MNSSRSAYALLLALGALSCPAGAEDPAPIRLTRDGLDKIRPAFTPDGKSLVFARHEPGGDAIRLYIADRDDPGPPESWKRLTDRKEPEYQATPSPDGKRFVLTGVQLSGSQGNLDLFLLDAGKLTPSKLIGDTGSGLSHQEWPAWSPDGKRLAYSSTHEANQEIYAADANGGDVVRITRHPGTDAHPCWTPDCRWILFATDRWGGLELAKARPDGTEVTRLTKSPGLDDYPAVAPDGRRVAFVSRRDGQPEIYVMDLDQPDAPPINASKHPARDTFPAWSPDGKSLAFVSDRESAGDLFRLDLP